MGHGLFFRILGGDQIFGDRATCSQTLPAIYGSVAPGVGNKTPVALTDGAWVVLVAHRRSVEHTRMYLSHGRITVLS